MAHNHPELPAVRGWRELGIDRLLEMLDNTVDADGVEVENSPFYHVYVLGLVSQIAAWAERYEPEGGALPRGGAGCCATRPT